MTHKFRFKLANTEVIGFGIGKSLTVCETILPFFQILRDYNILINFLLRERSF